MASCLYACSLFLFLRFSIPSVQGIQMSACSSDIFCNGKLLHDVQMSRIFKDSKTFVDLRMQDPPSTILQEFQKLGNVTRDELHEFVKKHFSAKPENDLEAWTPEDWKLSPNLIENIKDKNLRKFADVLNQRWKELARKIKEDAKTNTDRSSLIIVNEPFVIPGGRFREYYYWDSYWVLKGLLICEMYQTAKGMIKNFLQLVDTYGFVPNGGRVYYTNRSQPPFLIPMMELYHRFTNDTNFVKDKLPTLVKEYDFWQKHRQVTVNISGVSYILNRYNAQMNTPRPESYYEDFETAKGLETAEKEALYQDIASAAESGWDFSTRWFNRTSSGAETMRTTRTRQIVPVDLNGILYKCERILENFYKMIGDNSNAKEYKSKAQKRRDAIEAVMWDEASGLYQDYDLQRKQRNSAFFAATMTPLWAGVHDGSIDTERKVVKALQKLKVLDYPGGFPTSLEDSGQQWDFPNAWPPLQHIAIEALGQSKDSTIQNEAFKLAQKWVQTNWRAWETSMAIYEKYNVLKQGDPGHGGEYEVQLGFGWTNGVILDLLYKYPKTIKVASPHVSLACSTFPSILVLVVSIIIFIL